MRDCPYNTFPGRGRGRGQPGRGRGQGAQGTRPPFYRGRGRGKRPREESDYEEGDSVPEKKVRFDTQRVNPMNIDGRVLLTREERDSNDVELDSNQEN